MTKLVARKVNRVPRLLKVVQGLMKKEQWREAIALLKQREPLVENHWELLWNLGWSHLKLERLDQAEKYLNQAFRIASSNRIHTCKFGLGIVYLEQKHYRKAERALSDVLRIKEMYVARLGLALAYSKRGKIQKAEHTHLEGIKLRPQNCERYEGYADFLSDVGRETESIEMNKKANGLKRIN